MKRLIITSINFNYANGEDAPISTVDLHFMTTDAPFNMSGKVSVSRDAYNQAGNDMDALKELALGRVVSYFGKELAE